MQKYIPLAFSAFLVLSLVVIILSKHSNISHINNRLFRKSQLGLRVYPDHLQTVKEFSIPFTTTVFSHPVQTVSFFQCKEKKCPYRKCLQKKQAHKIKAYLKCEINQNELTYMQTCAKGISDIYSTVEKFKPLKLN